MSDEVEYGMSKHVNDARIISLIVDRLNPLRWPYEHRVDYLIRVMINGKYYVGKLELTE